MKNLLKTIIGFGLIAGISILYIPVIASAVPNNSPLAGPINEARNNVKTQVEQACSNMNASAKDKCAESFYATTDKCVSANPSLASNSGGGLVNCLVSQGASQAVQVSLSDGMNSMCNQADSGQKAACNSAVSGAASECVGSAFDANGKGDFMNCVIRNGKDYVANVALKDSVANACAQVDASQRDLCNSVIPGAITGCVLTDPGTTGNQQGLIDCVLAQNGISLSDPSSILTAVLQSPGSPINTAGGGSGKKCGGVDVAFLECPTNGGKGIENSGLWGVLTVVLNIMLAGVGIIAVGGIVYASILYASAQDNQQQVQQAKDIIRNVVIGLVAYACMYGLLQFLIPGGVF